jgi:predicted ATPase
MPVSSQHDYIDTELDPGILSTPFKTQTNWHVITGASCSGKTTLIDQLAGEGFHVVPEVGREYFERELAKGLTIDEIRQDRAALTRQIYDMMLKRERGLGTVETTFLDRGIPDASAFYRYAGMNPNDILPDCFKYRYASVFILDRFPYQQDGVRGGDDISADYFESWMRRDYRALGYDVVRVPVLPPEDRLAFVLEWLSERDLV